MQIKFNKFMGYYFDGKQDRKTVHDRENYFSNVAKCDQNVTKCDKTRQNWDQNVTKYDQNWQ